MERFTKYTTSAKCCFKPVTDTNHEQRITTTINITMYNHHHHKGSGHR